MIAAAITFVVLAVIAMVAQQERIERMQARYDRLLVTHARTCDRLADMRQKHLVAFRRGIKAEADAAELRAHVASLEADLIAAGVEASTHANHLEALLEATQEPALRLVRGRS